VLISHKGELRRLQMVKQRLIEDTSNTFWQRENEHSSFKLVKTVGELITTISQLINSAQTSIFLVAHFQFNLFSMGGFLEHLRYAVARGVSVRGVLEIHPSNSLVAHEYLSRGVELRHTDNYRGMTMVIADGKRSVSLISPYLKTVLSLDENVAALWSDNTAQVKFLVRAFKMIWTQAINAEEGINQQLQQDPPHEGFREPAHKTRYKVAYTAEQQPSLTNS
jgi:hypothetical protein